MIKKLKWNRRNFPKCGTSWIESCVLFGDYCIEKHGNEYVVFINEDKQEEVYPQLKKAKACCQKHFEAVINTYLE